MEQHISRDVYLFGEIEINNVLQVIQQIHAINDFDEAYERALKGYEREPILLHINSGGGDVTAGFSLISAIRMSDTPIVGVATGICASMALGIFASCHYTLASVYARFMYHSISYGIGDKLQGHVEQLTEAKHLQRMYDHIILKNTNLAKAELEQIQREKRDFWFGAKESVKNGLADELYEKEPKATKEEDEKVVE